MTSLAERLDQVESKIRDGWRAVPLAVCGLVATLGLLGSVGAGPRPAADEVRARRVILVDAAGRERATMMRREDGTPIVALRDEKGTARIALTLGADGSPALRVYDDQERIRARVGLGPDQAGMVMLLDAKGRAT